MNELTREAISTATAVELRKMAAAEKIPGASKGKKAELAAALLEIVEKREKAAKPAGNRCEICGTRARMPKGRMLQLHGVSFPYCEPCLLLAEWENTHSDYGHDEANQDAECWICHPELDRTQAAVGAGRQGTSRIGMRLTVPQRAAGADKAKVVAEKLGEAYAVTINTSNGQTVLRAARAHEADLKIVWDAAGRFVYGPSTLNGKKVMNVSGALRALGI